VLEEKINLKKEYNENFYKAKKENLDQQIGELEEQRRQSRIKNE
jgi:protein tyrosine/serine phosphatase